MLRVTVVGDSVVFLFVFSGVRWARMKPKVFVYFIQLFLWIVTCIHGYDYKQLRVKQASAERIPISIRLELRELGVIDSYCQLSYSLQRIR